MSHGVDELENDEAEQVESFTTCRVPGFVSKVFQIFTDADDDSLCVWGRDGRTIVIRNIALFQTQVLPKYFKHSNYTSFVRQLNMYEFHKTVANPLIAEFHHPYFLSGRSDLLHLVKRKSRGRKNVPPSHEVVPAAFRELPASVELGGGASRKQHSPSSSSASSSSSSSSDSNSNSSNQQLSMMVDSNQLPIGGDEYDMGVMSSSWMWAPNGENSTPAFNLFQHETQSSSSLISPPAPNSVTIPPAPNSASTPALSLTASSSPSSSSSSSCSSSATNPTADVHNVDERIKAVEQKFNLLNEESIELKRQLEVSLQQQASTQHKLESFMNYMSELFESFSGKPPSITNDSTSFVKVDLNTVASAMHCAISGSDDAVNGDNTIVSEVATLESPYGNNVTVTVDVESLTSSVNEAISEHHDCLQASVAPDNVQGAPVSTEENPAWSLSSHQVAEVVADAMNATTITVANPNVSFVTSAIDVDGRSSVIMSLATATPNKREDEMIEEGKGVQEEEQSEPALKRHCINETAV